MVRLLVAATVASFLLVACSAEDDNEGGFGVAQLADPADVDAPRGPITGEVEIAGNGCLHLVVEDGSRPWIVWPAGSDLAEGGGVTADGQEFGDGDAVAGTGAVVTLADLPDGGNPDSYFASFGGFCDAGSLGVVVLDSVAVAGS